jgi:hypothetical protein
MIHFLVKQLDRLQHLSFSSLLDAPANNCQLLLATNGVSIAQLSKEKLENGTLHASEICFDVLSLVVAKMDD